MIDVNALIDLLTELNIAAPRYTSYPTAPQWSHLDAETYLEKLKSIDPQQPLSLYFHIPFCHSMCLFCGCSVILNRNADKERIYVEALQKEISLITQQLGSRRKVSQLHFGGGTPTKLSSPLFKQLFDTITAHFEIDFEGEIAIEIDPRTISADPTKLTLLKELGFNRVSFGVQDTSPQVQEVIKRRQSQAMTQETYLQARSLGFAGINIDLIYGLPLQTSETFKETLSTILMLRPDRIALFSYAHVPWLKAHQKALKEEWLPSPAEKFRIYAEARQRLIENGYVAIGMDHFALQEDSLAQAYLAKKLQRNFQGYTVAAADHLIGFGVTAIGGLEECYAQNIKELDSYLKAVERGTPPIAKGKILTAEDQLRRWVIQSLMCNFNVDKALFKAKFQRDFDHHFSHLESQLQHNIKKGLLTNSAQKIEVTSLGELFLRNIALHFDAYYTPEKREERFSKTI